MKFSIEAQSDAITDETRARIAMIRPILRATLFALHGERVDRLGGFSAITLADLAREYREGSGDCGICFEYAIHDAIERNDPLIQPRIAEVLDTFCGLSGQTRSILYGIEKGKKLELVKTAAGLLTTESRLLIGRSNRPIKLEGHLDQIRRYFNRPGDKEALPKSIRGLWRADLFVGTPDRDCWVATTLKINPRELEGDAGIRIGIYPEDEPGEAPAFDERRNLILCPVPYDGGFMELFQVSFFLVKTFLASDAQVPKPVALPSSKDRRVARLLEERRKYPVMDIIEALEVFAQPNLLISSGAGDAYPDTATSAVAPVARMKDR